MSPKKQSESLKAIREAEKALEKAKLARRASFRKAVADVFNEYEMSLESAGDLEIVELNGRTVKAGDLPE